MKTYPTAVDAEMVGSYPALTFSGGGYFWDEVLEYRVWAHPRDGAEDLADGDLYFHSFATHEEAVQHYENHVGSHQPIVLVLQKEWAEQTAEGVYEHRKESRMTEWAVSFWEGYKRLEHTIPDFLAANSK